MSVVRNEPRSKTTFGMSLALPQRARQPWHGLQTEGTREKRHSASSYGLPTSLLPCGGCPNQRRAAIMEFGLRSRRAPAGALLYRWGELCSSHNCCPQLLPLISAHSECPDPRGGWLPRRGSTDVGKSRKEAHLEYLNMWLLECMASPWKPVPLTGPIQQSLEAVERCPWSQVRLSCTCRIWCLCSFEMQILKKPLPIHPSITGHLTSTFPLSFWFSMIQTRACFNATGWSLCSLLEGISV